MSEEDELASSYRLQVESVISEEAQRRIAEYHNPEELQRLRNLSIISLYRSQHSDLIPALMARLGYVRYAFDGLGCSLD